MAAESHHWVLTSGASVYFGKKRSATLTSSAAAAKGKLWKKEERTRQEKPERRLCRSGMGRDSERDGASETGEGQRGREKKKKKKKKVADGGAHFL